MMRRKNLDALFHPRNVALVGASERRDHWSKRVWDNLIRFGYPGQIFPVNPKKGVLWGQRCFPRLADLPEKPDHLAIFTPADVTIELLREGAAAGARSATLYAAGFGEGANAQGQELAARLRTVLDETGITAIGPSCMGLANGSARFCTIPDETLQPLGRSTVALVAQSGAICGSINRSLNELGLQLGYIASCGSQIGCTLSEFLEYFADQDELKTILCYIEAIPDAERFLNAARKARENGKSVVTVKVGGSDEARASALAHTGSLAGRTEIFDAYASAAGIVRMPTLEDAIEAVEFLARAPLPRGKKIAAMTVSGAVRSLIIEAAATTGAELARFSESTTGKLNELLSLNDVQNPLDTRVTRPTDRFISTLNTLLEAPEVDIVLVADELPLGEGTARKLANLQAMEEVGRRANAAGKSLALFSPLLVGTSEQGRALRDSLRDIAFLRTTGRAIRVLKGLADAGTAKIHSGRFHHNPVDNEVTRRWRERARTLSGPTALNEIESKALLGGYGIKIPREQVAKTAAEAQAAAEAIGFPVVMKGVSALVPHKSDAGFVILQLSDAIAVRRAFEEINRKAAAIGIVLDGVLVAEMAKGGIETILGVGRDAEMGPFLMFGMGGVLVDLFQDVRFAPVGLTREKALSLIDGARVSLLLNGFRGARPSDRDALVDAVCNLDRLARELADVIEAVDINPLLVQEKGKGIIALDALVVLHPPSM